MYEQWIIALLIAPLAISLASFACGVTKTRTICTALHVTGLILMLAFTLQIINGVLTQGEISALHNWVYIDSLSAIFLGLYRYCWDFSRYLFYRLHWYGISRRPS